MRHMAERLKATAHSRTLQLSLWDWDHNSVSLSSDLLLLSSMDNDVIVAGRAAPHPTPCGDKADNR